MSDHQKHLILRVVFIIAGVYDVVLGLTLLFGRDIMVGLFNVVPPSPYLIAQTCGLFLVTVGYLLLYAANAPETYAFVGLGSAFVRLSFGVLVSLSIMTGNPPDVLYILFGLTDSLTGLLLLSALVVSHVGKEAFWPAKSST